MSAHEKSDPPVVEPTASQSVVEPEAKRRFREALDRKQARRSPSASADPTTTHPHTTPVKPSKSFRRKTG